MKPSGLGRKAGIICFWLVLWQFISIAVHNSIILVGPAEVAGALIAQISTAEFWRTIGLTFGKISTGFLGAFLAGILTGSAACTICASPTGASWRRSPNSTDPFQNTKLQAM